MKTIHPSKAGLLLACPQSHKDVEGGLQIEPDSESARLGSAVHEALARMVMDEEPDMGLIADEWRIKDREELQILYNVGRARWRDEISLWTVGSGGMGVEIPLNTQLRVTKDPDKLIELSGTIDVYVSMPDSDAIIIDWKSGRIEPDAYHQMKAYAELVGCTGIANIKAAVIWLRGNEGRGAMRTWTFAPKDLEGFGESLVWAIAAGKDYRPGYHCQYCPRQYNCPACNQMLEKDVGFLANLDFSFDNMLAHKDQIGGIYERVSMVERACKDFRSQAKAFVQRHGAVPMEDGKRELTTITKSTPSLDPLEAWGVISDLLTSEEIAPAMKLSLPKLKDAVAANAERGQKKEEKDLLEAELDKAGAITRTESTQLRIKKIEAITEEKEEVKDNG